MRTQKKKRNQNKANRDRSSTLVEPDSTTFYTSEAPKYPESQLRSLLDLTTSICRFCNKSIPHFSPEEFIGHLKLCNEDHNKSNTHNSNQDIVKPETDIILELSRTQHGALKNYLPPNSTHFISTNSEPIPTTVNMRKKMKTPKKKSNATAIRPEVIVIEEIHSVDSQVYAALEDEHTETVGSNHSGSTIEAIEQYPTEISPVDANPQQIEQPSLPPVENFNEPPKEREENEDLNVNRRRKKPKSSRPRRRVDWERDENHCSSSNSGLGKKRRCMVPPPSWVCTLAKFNNSKKKKKEKKNKQKETKKSHNSSDSPFESNVDTSDDNSHPTRERKMKRKFCKGKKALPPFSISVKVQENNIMQTLLAPGPSYKINNPAESSNKLTIVGKTKGSVKQYPEFRLTCAAVASGPNSPYSTSGNEDNSQIPYQSATLPQERNAMDMEVIQTHDTDNGIHVGSNTVALEVGNLNEINQVGKVQELPEENNAIFDEIINNTNTDNLEDIFGIIDTMYPNKTNTPDNGDRTKTQEMAQNSNAYNAILLDEVTPVTYVNKVEQKNSSEQYQYKEDPYQNRRGFQGERWYSELPMPTPQYYRPSLGRITEYPVASEARQPSVGLQMPPTRSIAATATAVYPTPSPPMSSMRFAAQHMRMPSPVGQPGPMPLPFEPYPYPRSNYMQRNAFSPVMNGSHHYAYTGESHYQKTTTVMNHHIINVMSRQETVQVPVSPIQAPTCQMYSHQAAVQSDYPWPPFVADREQELYTAMQTTGRQQSFIAEGRSHSYNGVPQTITTRHNLPCCNCLHQNGTSVPTAMDIRGPFLPQMQFGSPLPRERQPCAYNILKRTRSQEEYYSPINTMDRGRKKPHYNNFNTFK